jgi:hypothetical protein
MIFASTVRAQAVISVVRSSGVHLVSRVADTRGNPGGILGLRRRGPNARDTAADWHRRRVEAARSILRGRPHRLGEAGDRGDQDRSEVAAVKRRRLALIHEEGLVVANRAAALPDRKRASAVIYFMRSAPLASVDRDDGPGAADRLPLQRENWFEQRHAARKVAALREPSRKRLRRIDDGDDGDGQTARGAHSIEPDQDAPGDVPDEARDRSGIRGHRDRGNGHDRGHEYSGTACHDINRFLRSQA